MRKLPLLISFIMIMGSISAQQFPQDKTADSLFEMALLFESKGDTIRAVENFTKAGDHYFTRIDLSDLSDTLTLRKFFKCQKILVFQKSKVKTSYRDMLINFLEIVDTCILNRNNVEKLWVVTYRISYSTFQYQRTYNISKKLLLSLYKNDSINNSFFYLTSQIYTGACLQLKKYDTCINYAKRTYQYALFNNKDFCIKMADILLRCYGRRGDYD
ncbi:MAG: hypothetical protein ACM3N9_03305, partial [Syntrophothermus sp.]